MAGKVGFLLCSPPFQWHNTLERLQLLLAYDNFEIPWSLFVLGQAIHYGSVRLKDAGSAEKAVMSIFKMLQLSDDGEVFLCQAAVQMVDPSILDFWKSIGSVLLLDTPSIAKKLRDGSYHTIWSL